MGGTSLTVASRTMNAFPNTVPCALIASQALARLGRWDECLATAKQWRKRAAHNPRPADITIARAAIKLKDAATAIKAIAPYIESSKRNPDAGAEVIVFHAQLLLLQGRNDQATVFITPLLERSPRLRAAWARAAHQSTPDHSLGARLLNDIEKVTPENETGTRMVLVQSMMQLAIASKQPQHRAAAQTILNGLLKGKDAPAMAWFISGTIQEQDNDLAKAESSYRQSLKRDPNLAYALNNLAMLLSRTENDRTEALTLAERAVKLRPTDPNAYDTLAQVQLKAQHYDKSIATIQSAIRIDNEGKPWRDTLKLILKEAGRETEYDRIIASITRPGSP